MLVLPPLLINAARHNQIMVAVTQDDQFAGYILFRIVKSKSRAAITHLCVKRSLIGHGAARHLVDALIEHTKELRGISLFCRRDYESNKFWSYIGFVYQGEKEGRGRDRMPLTHYWYDHKHPDLFSLVNDQIIESRSVKAVIDANIFYSLFEDSEHPLLADWLFEDLALCITQKFSVRFTGIKIESAVLRD